MALTSGSKLGPYEIHAPLGAGGMGEVYRARDTRLNRTVAIKVLPDALALDPDRLRRFNQEARAVASISHPNILALYDVGTSEQTVYLVSEYLEGNTLRERLRGGALPVRRACEWADQIANGLSAAHDQGITHRDLKPENIFLHEEDGAGCHQGGDGHPGDGVGGRADQADDTGADGDEQEPEDDDEH